MILLVQ
jgi:hypothetical protein